MEATFSESQKLNSDDFLDVTARYTHLNGGSVYGMPQNELPEKCLVAAILRY